MPRDLDPTLARRVAAVAADHLSGASAITREAIATLIDAHAFDRHTVALTACALCDAQPAMASVWNAAALASSPDGLNAVTRFGRQVDRAPRALARVFTDVMLTRRGTPSGDPGPLGIATVSASETVRSCLEALAAVADVRVICAEGRPLMEGRRMAAELAASGIPTTVCTDAAVGAVLEAFPHRLEAVVTGADAVSPRWFINKCGTRLLAASATSLGVPTCVLASRDKFLDGLLASELRPNLGPPEEVWDSPPARVTVTNPYFERVPLDTVATFVTDVGPVGSGSVTEICGSTVRPPDAARFTSLMHQTRK